jgi:hypothetical protein
MVRPGNCVTIEIAANAELLQAGSAPKRTRRERGTSLFRYGIPVLGWAVRAARLANGESSIVPAQAGSALSPPV